MKLLPQIRPRAANARLVDLVQFDDLDQGFPLLDDVGRKFRAFIAADVSCAVNRSRRDEEDIPGLQRHRRLALESVLPRPLEDIDDLLAGMPVTRGDRSRIQFNAHLDHFASRGAEVVPLQFRAIGSHLLGHSPCAARGTCSEQHCRGKSKSQFHQTLLWSSASFETLHGAPRRRAAAAPTRRSVHLSRPCESRSAWDTRAVPMTLAESRRPPERP